MMPRPGLMRALGYAGLLPFVAFAAAVWLMDGYVHALAQQGFLVYSLAILCFLAGTLWGSVGNYPEAAWSPRLLVSNGVVIFAVLAMLTAQPMVAALLLMVGHLAQLWYERNTPSPWDGYISLRTQLTLTAVVLHLVYAAGLMLRTQI